MSVEFIKRQAKQASKVLPTFLEQHSPPFSHSLCLDLVSKLHGFPNYHAAQTTEARAEQRKGTRDDTHAAHAVHGPWWCDVCGERIEHVDDGYVVFRSQERLAFDFLVIHKVRCDPRGDYRGSMAFQDLVGGLGLARMLSFLAIGPLMSAKDSTHLRVQHLEEFIDLLRRLQVPGYEAARRYFDDPIWRDRLSDWNEIAPYDPEELAHMLTWEISDAPSDAPHLDLVGVPFRGKATIVFSDGSGQFDVDAVFDPLALELGFEDAFRPVLLEMGASEPGPLHFALCADGAFRCAFTDRNGNTEGNVELILDDTSGTDPHILRGRWTIGKESCAFTVTLDAVE